MILGVQKTFGHDDLILVLVGEGLHLRHIHLAVDIDGLGLLGEHHGHAKLLGHKAGDTDAGSLDGQHLGDVLIRETAVKFPSDLLQQRHIHLVIEEAVHLQHIAGLDDAVLHDPFFQKIHTVHLLCLPLL